MKKGVILVLIGFGIGTMIQGIRIVNKLLELRKIKKETKRKEEELEKLKKEIAELEKMQEIKRQIEEQKAKTDAEVERIKRLIKITNELIEAKTDEKVNEILTEAVESGVINKPWKGDFREFMSDRNNTLDFG